MSLRDKLIAFNNPETGMMSLRIPVWDDPTRKILDDQQFIESIQDRTVPKGIKSTLIDSSSLAKLGRYFRDAWELSGSSVIINMEKARKIHLDVIRAKRNEQIAALDIPFMIALERGDQDSIADISKTKQTLRDIPQTIDLKTGIDTPAKLQSTWPDQLSEN